MAKGYTIPVDLLIDRMGWSSPIVSINETFPVYGSKVTAMVDAPSSDVKSLQAQTDIAFLDFFLEDCEGKHIFVEIRNNRKKSEYRYCD